MTDTNQQTTVSGAPLESPDDGGLGRLREELEALKADIKALQNAAAEVPDASGPSGIQTKTQGVREPLGAGRQAALEKAARAAARSGSRMDVQEYMRIRRRFV